MKCVHCESEKSFIKQSKNHQYYVRFCSNCGRMLKIEKPPAATERPETNPTNIIQQEELI